MAKILKNFLNENDSNFVKESNYFTYYFYFVCKSQFIEQIILTLDKYPPIKILPNSIGLILYLFTYNL